MGCAEIREKFSSLLEGDLSPLEEKNINEHLRTCPECQKDFQKFERTIRWLHSMEEAEVPDGFLSEIQKKMEERKRLSPEPGKGKWGRFNTLTQWKLPAQAVAMVAIVFVVLYVTRMMPTEQTDLKVAKQEEISQPEEKLEMKAVVKEEKKREGGAPLPAEAPQQSDLEDTRGTTPTGKETQPASVPAPSVEKAEAPAGKTPHLKERAEGPPSEKGRQSEQLMPRRKVFFAAKPSRDIILRVSDREKAFFQVREVLKQHGGEIEKEEENTLLASLPETSLSEFEKRLAELSSSEKLQPAVPYKDSTPGRVSVPEAKKRETAEKGREGRISIRILFLPE